MVDAVQVVGRDLRNRKLQLRSVIPIEELEKRRQHKLRQLYLEEKSDKEQYQTEKQQQQISNQDVARMALARRKELERLRDEEQRKEEKRLEEHKAEMRRAEERRAEERRAEQRKAEERRAEQRRAEQRREEQRRAERRAEEQRAELRKAEERREEQRRAERRVEEQMAERRRAEERREDIRRAEQRRIEEQRAEQRKVEERRAEQRRIEEQRAEQRREEERRIEQRRIEEQRAEEQRKLELEEANKAEQRKDHQQLLAAEELLRRVTGDTSTTVKFGEVKRQSVSVDDPQNKKSVPSNQWYNSTSSGVPLRNSTLVQSSEQWGMSASGGRPNSMEILDFSTPKHTPVHHREGPIGGYPSPPRHKAPPPPVPKSANQTKHQTRLNATDKPHNRAHTLGYHTAAVVHPVPSQTHHNQLDNGFRDQHLPGWNKKLNNYPSNSPPKRREPYKTTYTNTEHGPTLYSMV